MTIKLNDITLMKGNIFVTGLEEGMRMTRGGIIRLDDNFKDTGIRPRWGKIWKTSADIDYVTKDEWVLVEHGRWTLRTTFEFSNGETVDVWKIDPEAILLVSDQNPLEDQQYKP